MPETYKGLNVPQYSDTADGVAAIRNLIDSGPIARVDDAQLGEITELGPEVGTVVYYETLNLVLQWCGPTMTWKPLWGNPWGRVAHWEGTSNSTHTSTPSTVAGLSDIDWTAYSNRYYKVTVSGRLTWIDEGASQGLPDWSVDTKVARAIVTMRANADNAEVLRVYDGRASFMYANDTDIFSTSWIVGGLDGEQSWKLVAQSTTPLDTDDFTFAFTTTGGAKPLVLIEDIGPSGAPT